MKEYKEPAVKIIEFDAADIITTSGDPDTQGEIGGNLVGGSTPTNSAAPTNLGIGGSQQ